MSVFRPFLLKKNITAVTAAELRDMGVTCLLLDVDNTLTAHDSQLVDETVKNWLSDMRAAGFQLMIVSNGREKRVAPFADRLSLPYTAMAAKPLPFGFWRAAHRLGVKQKYCAVIGDQIFTDVLGGKLAGMQVIQLLPLAPETDKPFIAFKRKLERKIMKNWHETEELR